MGWEGHFYALWTFPFLPAFAPCTEFTRRRQNLRETLPSRPTSSLLVLGVPTRRSSIFSFRFDPNKLSLDAGTRARAVMPPDGVSLKTVRSIIRCSAAAPRFTARSKACSYSCSTRWAQASSQPPLPPSPLLVGDAERRTFVGVACACSFSLLARGKSRAQRELGGGARSNHAHLLCSISVRQGISTRGATYIRFGMTFR